MFGLYVLSIGVTSYYFYKFFYNLFYRNKNLRFEDSILDDDDAYVDYVELIYTDSEDIEHIDYKNSINCEKLDYVCINYTHDGEHKVLFNTKNLNHIFLPEFPFYKNINKLPMYNEIENAMIIIDDKEYDITEEISYFKGPNYNYHQDINGLFFEELVEYFKLPIEKDATGKVLITDSLENLHVLNYPGELKFNEQLTISFPDKEEKKEESKDESKEETKEESKSPEKSKED